MGQPKNLKCHGLAVLNLLFPISGACDYVSGQNVWLRFGGLSWKISSVIRSQKITVRSHQTLYVLRSFVITVIVVFWVVTPCSFVGGYRRFRGTCCRNLKFEMLGARNWFGYIRRLQSNGNQCLNYSRLPQPTRAVLASSPAWTLDHCDVQQDTCVHLPWYLLSAEKRVPVCRGV